MWFDLIVYYLAVIGLTMAFSKLYVGKWFREGISGIGDEQFYGQAGSRYEDPDRYLSDPKFKLPWSYCEVSWGFRQSYLGRLVRCPACSGFWIGLVMSGAVFLDYMSYFSYVHCVMYALGGSALSILFWFILVKLGVLEHG